MTGGAYLVVALHSEPDLCHGVQVSHVSSSSVASLVVHVQIPQYLHHQQQLNFGLLQSAVHCEELCIQMMTLQSSILAPQCHFARSAA